MTSLSLSISQILDNTRVRCHYLFQEIFLTQELNLCLWHWQVDSLPLSHEGSPYSTNNRRTYQQLLHKLRKTAHLFFSHINYITAKNKIKIN